VAIGAKVAVLAVTLDKDAQNDLTQCSSGAVILSDANLSLHPEQQAVTAETTDLNEVERQTIEHVMRDLRGNKSKAAKRLGLTRTQLCGRLRKYGLDTADS
jgi:transcriptional regulator with GAF, ATPase, and Fis domain